MNIPIFDGGKIVALAGVGNKGDDYNGSDVRQLELMMDGMWKILQRKEFLTFYVGTTLKYRCRERPLFLGRLKEEKSADWYS